MLRDRNRAMISLSCTMRYFFDSIYTVSRLRPFRRLLERTFLPEVVLRLFKNP